MPDLTFALDFIGLALPLECLEPRFMRLALLGLVLLSPLCAVMGVQVVNLRMAFFSDAVSHSALTGLALGILLGLNERLSMLGFGVLAGVAIMTACRKLSLSADTVIGVFFSTVIAFGLAVVSREQHLARNLQMFLYGDILTIGESEIAWLAVIFVIISLFQALAFNRLLYIGLNPVLAQAHGVGVKGYQYVFAALLSFVVIFSVWAVGVLLVTALLVLPAACGRNLARSAGGMFWWAIVVGLSSSLAGLIISAQPWAGTATGATVILCASLWFFVSLVFARFGRRVKS